MSWSKALQACVAAADELGASGIDAEVIDLRTLWPWDRARVCASAGRTGALLVVHEAVQVGGFGGEVAAAVAEEPGCRVRRLGAPRIPARYARTLEDESRVSVAQVAGGPRTRSLGRWTGGFVTGPAEVVRRALATLRRQT